MQKEKKAVQEFWNNAACGEDLYLTNKDKNGYVKQAQIRYGLEPYIAEFAQFENFISKNVLEIGVGLGADHEQFARAGANAYGTDITFRAVEHTRHRFKELGLHSSLNVSDAELLPFKTNTFDLVYSWGVLHHSPDTKKAIEEAYRVLRPGGQMKIMVYHKFSFVGYMLWLRYALLKFRPFVSLDKIYAAYLESPGTKAFSRLEASELLKKFNNVSMRTVLTHADLLTSEAGQRHKGHIYKIAKMVWPRWLIRSLLPTHGLFLLLSGIKPLETK